MKIKLYNSLSNKKEDFSPLVKDEVKMYVCGPTVYNDPHIGNARPAVVFDILYRLLLNQYKNVVYVRNITDIDDKIIDAANKRKVTIEEISDQYTESYHDDMKYLNNLSPTKEPRATDYIDEMVLIIQKLISKGFAYEKEKHVLFNVKKYDLYGKLSGRNLEDMIAGARVEVAPYKENEHDFVLWKPSDLDSPGWESPWGTGRPGWHIECVAMINKILGPVIDIHGGGQDLIFPHHENEIAQSCCANDNETFVRFWMHNGYLKMEGEKMSKSLGNIVTVKELSKDYKGEVIRLALLLTHYRKPINFSKTLLDQAKKILDKLYKVKEEVYHIKDKQKHINDEVIEALNDDLNTSLAITKMLSIQDKKELVDTALFLGFLDADPKEWFSSTAKSKILEKDVLIMIKQRDSYRKNGEFDKADLVRDELLQHGIILKDSNGATEWKYK
tara:strand:- start:39 stop:1370 length:1332 start_codon:yes stop_codon:yes gene_type:complete